MKWYAGSALPAVYLPRVRNKRVHEEELPRPERPGTVGGGFWQAGHAWFRRRAMAHRRWCGRWWRGYEEVWAHWSPSRRK